MQDQRFVAAQQARGVDARTERPAEPRTASASSQRLFMLRLYFARHAANRADALEQARAAASRIRYAVFVEEQGVPVEIELDGQDADCIHALALRRQRRGRHRAPAA